MQNDAMPQQIGRLSLGDKRSDGERLCSHCHTVPSGHPLYWPERMGEYPDDMDPLCLAHAIEQAVDDNGWCEKCTAIELTTAVPAEREATFATATKEQRQRALLLAEVELHLQSVRVFITTREKMHPCGVDLHDEVLAKVSTALNSIGRENVRG